MSEVTKFEEDLVATFRVDHRVAVPIDRANDEPFTESLDRIAAKVIDIMQRNDLYSKHETGEQVISNAQQSEDGEWFYSVRVQVPDEEE